jgi:hypothetical protein
VIGFYRVVRVPLGVVPRRRHQFVQYSGVDRCGVRDHLPRDHLEGPERSGEESAGGCGVSSGGEQHVDDLAVLVDGSVDVAPDTVDLDVGLVDEPPVAR